MNNYLHFLDERASVRQFDPDAILSNDLIREMLKHASYAPSSNNFQPWQVVVVKNKENLLITPHVAWGSLEARKTLIAKIVANIENFINESK